MDDLLQIARDAAPYVLAILGATTTLSHALARGARALERYAARTPAPWDDIWARRICHVADGIATALDWISALLPRVGLGRVPTEAPPLRRGPPGGGPLVMLLLCTISLHGCGHGQRVLTTQATVHAAHQPERFHFYSDQDARCGETHPDDVEAYRECMAPAYHLARAADSYRASLEAAQAALDASGEDGFGAALPALLRAAERLVEALSVAGVPVPDSVREVASLGGE